MPSPYEQQILADIARWEHRAPSVFNRFGALAARPVEWVADSIVPQHLQDLAGQSLFRLLTHTNEAVHHSIGHGPLLHHARRLGQQELETPAQLRGHHLPLSDALAGHFERQHVTATGISGAGLGLGGMLLLAVDVPTLFATNLRMIQHTALSFGYDLADPVERHFALQLLHASAGDPKAKLALLEELAMVRGALARAALNDVARGSTLAAALISLRRMAQRVGIEVTERKMLTMVPLIGAGIGAGFNILFTREVALAARMGYRKRWLAEKYPELFPKDSSAEDPPSEDPPAP